MIHQNRTTESLVLQKSKAFSDGGCCVLQRNFDNLYLNHISVIVGLLSKKRWLEIEKLQETTNEISNKTTFAIRLVSCLQIPPILSLTHFYTQIIPFENLESRRQS